MKRQYSHRRNLPRAVWGIGFALLIVLIIGSFRLLFPGAFFALSTPLTGSGAPLTASTGTVFSGFANSKKLVAENTSLQAQNETLKNQNAVLTARAQDLTKLLGGQETAKTGIPAGVLARPPESPYDTLTVGMGSADGVQINAEVYSVGGTPLGTIKHSTTHTAQVSLFSSPGRSTNAWVGTTRFPLTLTGQGGGSFSATVAKTSAVGVGDSVYAAGPGALPIGTVAKVDSDPSSPTIVIHVMPLVNLFSVTWVEISRTTS